MLNCNYTQFSSKENLIRELNIKTSEFNALIEPSDYYKQITANDKLVNGITLNDDELRLVTEGSTTSLRDPLLALHNIYLDQKFKEVFGSFEALAKMNTSDISDKLREYSELVHHSSANGYNILFYIISKASSLDTELPNKKELYASLAEKNPRLLTNTWCGKTPFEYAVELEAGKAQAPNSSDVKALAPLYTKPQLLEATVTYGNNPRKVTCLSYAAAIGNAALIKTLIDLEILSVQNITITEEDEKLATAIADNLVKLFKDEESNQVREAFEMSLQAFPIGFVAGLTIRLKGDNTTPQALIDCLKKHNNATATLGNGYADRYLTIKNLEDFDNLTHRDLQTILTDLYLNYLKTAIMVYNETGMPYLPPAEYLELPELVQSAMQTPEALYLHKYGFFTFDQYKGKTLQDIEKRLAITPKDAFVEAGITFKKSDEKLDGNTGVIFNWPNYYLLSWGLAELSDLRLVVGNATQEELLPEYATLQLYNREFTTFKQLASLPPVQLASLLGNGRNKILLDVCSALDGQETFQYFLTTNSDRWPHLIHASNLLLSPGNKVAGTAPVTPQELNALSDARLETLAKAQSNLHYFHLRKLVELPDDKFNAILSANGQLLLRSGKISFAELAAADVAVISEVIKVNSKYPQIFTEDLEALLPLPLEKIVAINTGNDKIIKSKKIRLSKFAAADIAVIRKVVEVYNSDPEFDRCAFDRKTELRDIDLEALLQIPLANLEALTTENVKVFKSKDLPLSKLGTSNIAVIKKVVEVADKLVESDGTPHTFSNYYLRELLDLPLEKIEALTTPNAIKFYQQNKYYNLSDFSQFEPERIALLVSDAGRSIATSAYLLFARLKTLQVDKLKLVIDCVKTNSNNPFAPRANDSAVNCIRINLIYIEKTDDMEKLAALLDPSVARFCSDSTELTFSDLAKLGTATIKQLAAENFGFKERCCNKYGSAMVELNDYQHRSLVKSNIDNPPAEGICERMKFILSKDAAQVYFALIITLTDFNKLPSNVIRNLRIMHLHCLLPVQQTIYRTFNSCSNSKFLNWESTKFERTIHDINNITLACSAAICMLALIVQFSAQITNIASVAFNYCTKNATNLPFVNTL